MKRIVSHDPHWVALFESEAVLIADVFGGAAVGLHHIGSTAVPGLQAKPIIDILVEASSLSAIDRCAERLAKLGYEGRGEYGIPGRRYFNKKSGPDTIAVHLHAYLADSYEVRRHLAFRDYLRLNPAITARYATLKTELSFEDGRLKPDYQQAKKPFVDSLALEALKYFEARR